MKRKIALETFATTKSMVGTKRAARAVGRSAVTLWRWDRAFRSGGLAALRPRFTETGRRSKVASVRLNGEAVSELESLFVQMGRDRAWRQFIQSPTCPPELAGSGLRTLPAPVARQVKLTALPVRSRAFISADGKRVLATIRFKRGTR